MVEGGDFPQDFRAKVKILPRELRFKDSKKNSKNLSIVSPAESPLFCYRKFPCRQFKDLLGVHRFLANLP